MTREVYIADPHQEFATAHIQRYRGAGLFMEMGLGKTAATLMAIVEMLRIRKFKTLVIAPLTVAQDVWSDEMDKWDFTKGLRYVKMLGSQKQRLAALHSSADVYIINWENLAWLIAELGSRWPFDYVVVDESSKFKSAKSRCFKSLRIKLPRIKRITLLTGTPRPNSLMDLWSQLFLIDNGVRLYPTLGEYRRTYFKEGMKSGYVVYNYNLKRPEKGTIEERLLGSEIYAEEIYDKISDVCISMREKDYAELPPMIIRDWQVSLSDIDMQRYRKFERDLVLTIDEQDVTPANAAVMTGKLLQFANGAVYDDKKKWHRLHDAKLDALEEIMEEANGDPVLVMYQYKHDLERILKRFQGYKPRIIKDTQSKRDWNAGKIKMGVAHAASIGHGNNLQAGGRNIVWFGTGWSLELFQQANKRLHRRNQQRSVMQYRIIAKGTMDLDTIASLDAKDKGQRGAMRALKARIKYWKQNKVA